MLGQDPGDSDPEGGWAIAEGEDGGKPLIIRFRNRRPPGIATQKYRHLVAVSWPYEPDNEGGMPPQDQVTDMQLFEDLLQAALEGPRQAYLTAIVTGNGVREWQWYSRDPAET